MNSSSIINSSGSAEGRMPRVHPCLWFDEQAEQAAEHYLSVFPNSRLGAITRYGPGGRMREGLAMTVSLELDGSMLTLLNGGPMFTHSPAASLVLTVQSQQELDRYWQSLSAVPEAERCGWLKDRWGIHWQVVPQQLMALMQQPDSPGKRRVGEALMQMRKIELPTLLAAYHGH